MLDRVTAVFAAFDHPEAGLGVTELARRANLPKSTVSRVAGELVDEGFLERDGDKLYLGMRLYELGQNVDAPRRLRRVALPVMAELRDLTGHTVTLGLREGDEVVLIAVVAGRAPSDAVGFRVAAADSAMGRALHEASDATTGRASHVSIVADERGSGTTHVAVPVFSGGQAVAALSLRLPTPEAETAAIEAVLRRAATALAHRL